MSQVAIREDKDGRGSEHEEREAKRIGPGVVADRFERREDHRFCPRAERHTPEALRGVALDPDHGQCATVRDFRRRVLALRRGAGDARHRAIGECVRVDIGLRVLASRREVEGAAVAREGGLVVVALAGRHVAERGDLHGAGAQH